MLLFFFLSCLIENFCLHLQCNFICNCNCLIFNMFESEFESRFPLKMKKTAFSCLFSFCTRANYDSHEVTPLTPSRGWGCKYSSREMPTSIVGSSPIFRSKTKGWLNASLFDFRIIRFLPSAPNTIYLSK